MKKVSKIVLFLLVASLALSACKVATITPPTEEPTATVEATEVATEVVVEPTENLTPQPTADTRLTGDDGNMVCTIVGPLFGELTPEQEAQLAVFQNPRLDLSGIFPSELRCLCLAVVHPAVQ